MSTNYVLRMAFLACLVLAHFTWSMAQEPSGTGNTPTISQEKRALIDQLMEVTEVKKNTVALFNALFEQNEKQLPDAVWQSLSRDKEMRDLSADQQQSMRKKLADESNRMSKRMREMFLERIDFGRLVQDLSYGMYDRYFTEAELKDLITFYGSATGKKTIEVMPKMIAESYAKTMEVLQPKLIEISAALTNEEADRVRKELQSRKSTQSVKPNPPRRSRKR